MKLGLCWRWGNYFSIIPSLRGSCGAAHLGMVLRGWPSVFPKCNQDTQLVPSPGCSRSIHWPVRRFIVLLLVCTALAPSAFGILDEGLLQLVANLFPDLGSSVLQAFVPPGVHLPQRTLQELWDVAQEATTSATTKPSKNTAPDSDLELVSGLFWKQHAGVAQTQQTRAQWSFVLVAFPTALFLFHAAWFLSFFCTLLALPTVKGRNPSQPSLRSPPWQQRSHRGGAVQVHSPHTSINSQSTLQEGARQAVLLLSSITPHWRNWGS